VNCSCTEKNWRRCLLGCYAFCLVKVHLIFRVTCLRHLPSWWTQRGYLRRWYIYSGTRRATSQKTVFVVTAMRASRVHIFNFPVTVCNWQYPGPSGSWDLKCKPRLGASLKFNLRYSSVIVVSGVDHQSKIITTIFISAFYYLAVQWIRGLSFPRGKAVGGWIDH
jgi:hypothetical protein